MDSQHLRAKVSSRGGETTPETAQIDARGLAGFRGRVERELAWFRDPFALTRARALLEQGKRREALALLEQGRERALDQVPEPRHCSGSSTHDLALAQPALEGLNEIASLARQVVKDAAWGSWDQDLVARFAALATDAERQARQLPAELHARSHAKRQQNQRRRLRKATALSLTIPLWTLVSLFDAQHLAPSPSTADWVLALVVAPIVLGALSTVATLWLWRRGVTSRLLYAPFCVGFVAAAAILARLLA